MSSLFSSATGIGSIFTAPATQPDAPKQKSISSSDSFGAAMTAVDKFMKYQEMTQAEKIRASYLAARGLTEEDLANLPPEEQKKIEEEILDAMKRKLGVKEVRA